MAERVRLTINGRAVEVAAGTTVAAALLNLGLAVRTSVHGEPRGPFCGMGICMECRATINGLEQQPTCQRLCEPGMEVVTA
jgi:sarcosine oxidase subunit alpha